ncbi:MAG: hypothetical protein SXA11_09390 [Cyanobacteriota bacterium]|nr:hypothetical protein [Cyanobacteriota bacterium]
MGKRFTILKDESILTTPLKKKIKWTPKKLTMVGIITLIPYSAIVFYVISSGMPTGAFVTMIAVPIVLVVGFSIIYNLTKNL